MSSSAHCHQSSTNVLGAPKRPGRNRPRPVVVAAVMTTAGVGAIASVFLGAAIGAAAVATAVGVTGRLLQRRRRRDL